MAALGRARARVRERRAFFGARSSCLFGDREIALAVDNRQGEQVGVRVGVRWVCVCMCLGGLCRWDGGCFVSWE